MAKITPHVFTDGQKGISDDLFDLFSADSGDYFTVINGDLNAENISTLNSVDYTNVQYNSFSGGGQVAGTASLDFFAGGPGSELGSGFFRGASVSTPSDYLAIPGASLQFYLPYDAYVLLTWTVTWVNDNNDDEKGSYIALFVDDNPVQTDVFTTNPTTGPYVRRVRRTMFGGSNADPGGSPGPWKSVSARTLQDRFKSRTWSGHYFTDRIAVLKAGWHSASLRLCADGTVKQTRVRARSMKYIYFKYGATK